MVTRMDDNSNDNGPIIVPTENWEKYKKRWYEAADLFDAGDVAGAVFQLKRLASEGFSPAFAELGDKYEFGGGGIEVDLAAAVEWYKRSVEIINDVRSHMGLARIYLQDPELDPDHSLALYHLHVLTETDVMGGWYGLGLVHMQGVGTEKDLEAAQRCLEKAVRMGHLQAGVDLAVVLLKSSQAGWFKTFVKYQSRKLLQKMRDSSHPSLGLGWTPPDT